MKATWTVSTIAVAAILWTLTGCAGLRQNAIQASEQDLQNIETAIQVSKNLLTAWPFKSGIIKATLGAKLVALPQEAVAAMTELDTLAANVDTLTDEQLGVGLGLHVRVLQEAVKAALEQFAPEILEALGQVALGL